MCCNPMKKYNADGVTIVSFGVPVGWYAPTVLLGEKKAQLGAESSHPVSCFALIVSNYNTFNIFIKRGVLFKKFTIL